ncbi:MAG: S-adenosylmethionine:tRNA ribosyltransferase-isomerase [Planctomycetes bacterium]|nr:S-adenosylmethionine:tRNA ribosyltransferase-isomerase [Planctomycetota bacterium]
MNATTRPRADVRATRLLTVDAHDGRIALANVDALAELFGPGDVFVVNDAATLPASLTGISAVGESIEARLAGEREDGTFLAVLFGAGDWHQPTERRPPPPVLAVGDELRFGSLAATIAAVAPDSSRLVRLQFDTSGPELVRALYRAGSPIQYSYLERPLAIWDVQTPFANRPWAVEPPSAALPLSWELVHRLRARGVAIARITHAAGLSSTGDATLDRRLPFRERYDVPIDAVVTIANATGRVVAAGTTVVRPLESAAEGGELAAGSGWTALRIGPDHVPRVVAAVLTGMHEPGTSHFDLLCAFAPATLLEAATQRAARAGLLSHEFGDLMLLSGDGERARIRPAAGAGAAVASDHHHHRRAHAAPS